MLLNLFTVQAPIIYENSAIQAELLIYKGDLRNTVPCVGVK